MKYLIATTLSLSMGITSMAYAQQPAATSSSQMLRAVSPALEAYTEDSLYGGVWEQSQSPSAPARP